MEINGGKALETSTDRPLFHVESKVDGYCGLCNVDGCVLVHQKLYTGGMAASFPSPHQTNNLPPTSSSLNSPPNTARRAPA